MNYLDLLDGAIPEWHADAACRRPGNDPAWWFPNNGDYQNGVVDKALFICNNTCPVRAKCLESAIENAEQYGIFGGTTAPQREPLIARKYAGGGEDVPRYVDSTGTLRRLRALACLGWSQDALAERIGMTTSTLNNFMRVGSSGRRVTPASAERVAVAYAELSGENGPSHLTARRAARRGWQPPEAWTTETIDDPHAIPDYPIGA